MAEKDRLITTLDGRIDMLEVQVEGYPALLAERDVDTHMPPCWGCHPKTLAGARPRTPACRSCRLLQNPTGRSDAGGW